MSSTSTSIRRASELGARSLAARWDSITRDEPADAPLLTGPDRDLGEAADRLLRDLAES